MQSFNNSHNSCLNGAQISEIIDMGQTQISLQKGRIQTEKRILPKATWEEVKKRE